MDFNSNGVSTTPAPAPATNEPTFAQDKSSTSLPESVPSDVLDTGGSSASQQVPQAIKFLDPFTPENNAPTQKKGSKVDRKEVVRKAKERREEIAAELSRAKMELWGTTIEQAVLIQLAKDKSFLERT